MKCNLSKNGIMTIESETDLEQYALNQWYEKKQTYELELSIIHKTGIDIK